MVSNSPPGELATSEGRRVFISSNKRNTEPDAWVAACFRDALGRQGHSVFIDVEMVPGTDRAESISAQIREAEFFVVLLSKASLAKGCYVPAETIVAAESHEQTGSPTILPVRLKYPNDLPLQLAGKIGLIHDIRWRGPTDTDDALSKLLEAVGPAGTRPSALERGDHFIVTASAVEGC